MPFGHAGGRVEMTPEAGSEGSVGDTSLWVGSSYLRAAVSWGEIHLSPSRSDRFLASRDRERGQCGRTWPVSFQTSPLPRDTQLCFWPERPENGMPWQGKKPGSFLHQLHLQAAGDLVVCVPPRPHGSTSEQGLRSPCRWAELLSCKNAFVALTSPWGRKSCPCNWTKAIGQNSGPLFSYDPQQGQCVKSPGSVLEVVTCISPRLHCGAEASKEEGAGTLGNHVSSEDLVRTPLHRGSDGSRASPGSTSSITASPW